MSREMKLIVIGGIVTVLLQVVIAPNIAIFQVVPNFMLVYSLVIAMLLPRDSVLVLAFALGLTSDLLGYGPVGGLAFLLTLAAFAAQRLHAVFGHDTVGAPLAILIALSLVVDILYAAFLLALSASLSPLDAFVYRALPCALYDAVLGLILYPLASRFIQGVQPTMKPVGPSQFR
ncbi:rod shape-determining protein MreD [Curtanaerobium respiraculi]|uniref:rod shape-determining protein MreD n=1 Tax=Curtanaerobium respiraculi TaxID=2949669 RepID=UPI0024B392A4|nr:rod shape-determining protein MreD [Curtanaerobium respiraculi]